MLWPSDRGVASCTRETEKSTNISAKELRSAVREPTKPAVEWKISLFVLKRLARKFQLRERVKSRSILASKVHIEVRVCSAIGMTQVCSGVMLCCRPNGGRVA